MKVFTKINLILTLFKNKIIRYENIYISVFIINIITNHDN